MSNEKTAMLQRLRIQYQGGEEGSALSVNGIVGQVVPVDPHSIYFALYFEHLTLPTEALREIQGTALGPEQFVESPADELRITRTVTGRFVVPAVKARELARWLLQKADEADANVRQQGVRHDVANETKQ